MHAQHYDLLAIGGGSGGIAAANRAASYGARAAVIERDRMGGTCVNRGCVPKKVMWYGANVAHTLDHADDFGFEIAKQGFDWNALVSKREAYIQRLNNAYDGNLARNGVSVIHGEARFEDANTVVVDGERYTADHIIIATGGAPTVPSIPGAELGITSDGFFCPQRTPQQSRCHWRRLYRG